MAFSKLFLFNRRTHQNNKTFLIRLLIAAYQISRFLLSNEQNVQSQEETIWKSGDRAGTDHSVMHQRESRSEGLFTPEDEVAADAYSRHWAAHSRCFCCCSSFAWKQITRCSHPEQEEEVRYKVTTNINRAANKCIISHNDPASACKEIHLLMSVYIPLWQHHWF